MHSPIWHPFTQHALEPRMKRIVKTEGAYLFDESNHCIFDAISSWWVITHAHRHPAIVKAIADTCTQLDQVIFAEYTHDPAERLANELITLFSDAFSHVFFSDSGSTAVEVALKMALGFFKHSGHSRSRIVVMEHGYHGDTIGAMSVGERGGFNCAYEPLLFEVDRLPFPTAGNEQNTLDAFESFCKQGDVAAILIEPLVLATGGFKIYPAWVLTELKRIAERYDSLFIADEVMTGWGRTGTLFACEQAGINPDILCTSKGLTGGALPLGATLCTAKIFNAHLSKDRRKTFFHSSSYTANPIACAAALANITIWKTEPVLQRISDLEKMHDKFLQPFYHDHRFTNVRKLGTIAALDLNVNSSGYFSTVAPTLRAFFRKKNVLLRPLGNVIYLLTPYCTNEKDLDIAYHAIEEAADYIASES